MKLVACQKCNDVVMLISEETRYCYCGDVAGKYLDDRITAVVNKNAIVFGIDNNGFNMAKNYATCEGVQELSHRVDYFFTGWVPNFPGEVIIVENIDDVVNYDYHTSEKDRNYGSTSPAELLEKIIGI